MKMKKTRILLVVAGMMVGPGAVSAQRSTMPVEDILSAAPARAQRPARATRAEPPMRVTRQPRRPQMQRFPWGSMEMWPISPATPVAPR